MIDLKEIIQNYEIILLDNNVLSYNNDNNCYQDKTNLRYMRDLIYLLKNNDNIGTIREILEESKKGFDKLYYMKDKIKNGHNNTKSGNKFKKIIDKKKRITESIKIFYLSEEEELALSILKEDLQLNDRIILSDVDSMLILKSFLFSEYKKKKTALLTNDLKILITGSRIKREYRCNNLDMYTSIGVFPQFKIYNSNGNSQSF